MWEFIKKYWKEILIILLIIVCIISIICADHYRQKSDTLNNNIEALTDSMEVLQLSNDDLLYTKQALILENKELTEYLELTEQKKKDIEKKLKSKIQYIASLKGKVHIDTLVVHDSIIIDSTKYILQFNYKDDWVALDGTSIWKESDSFTTINNLDMNVPLTVGMTKDNQLFATTSNPYVSFSSIEGATVINSKTKPKHWNVGIQVGFGGQYGLVNKKFDVGPYVGVGIAYGFSF